VVAAIAVAAVAAVPAAAHLKSDGDWTYRYHTRADDSSWNYNCVYGVGKVDPLNVLFWQFGEWSRMFDHANSHTHWYDWNILGSGQVMCISPTGPPYDGKIGMHEQAQGHGIDTGPRSHYRIFPAGHTHDQDENKWSTIDVHHESFGTHAPDEDWESWENHFVGEMEEHYRDPDAYCRYTNGSFRHFYDNGCVSRVGGSHV